jgi:hypothetical protein
MLTYIGMAVYFIGAVWLIYLAWTNDQPLMAVGIFCLGIIFGTVYVISHWDEAKIPYFILVGGFALQVVGRLMGT